MVTHAHRVFRRRLFFWGLGKIILRGSAAGADGGELALFELPHPG
jgi:hypothetical protein